MRRAVSCVSTKIAHNKLIKNKLIKNKLIKNKVESKNSR
jgi:hypothetical protein